MKKKQSIHYVDNKKLYAEMVKFISLCDDAKRLGLERPKVPDYVGEAILKIANGLSHKGNFIGYSYRDEMVSDGIENCLCYIHNFNPDKSKNPFAYFTQIIYYAFLRRIQKEKKQVYIKHKTLQNSMVMNTLVDMASEDAMHFNAAYIHIDDRMNDLVEKFETKNPSKKLKKGVEKFFEKEDVNEQG